MTTIDNIVDAIRNSLPELTLTESECAQAAAALDAMLAGWDALPDDPGVLATQLVDEIERALGLGLNPQAYGTALYAAQEVIVRSDSPPPPDAHLEAQYEAQTEPAFALD
jgi:hypothetical protein